MCLRWEAAWSDDARHDGDACDDGSDLLHETRGRCVDSQKTAANELGPSVQAALRVCVQTAVA